jgi:PAS domain S-box-containing protein
VINKKNSGEKQYLELSTSPIAYNGKEAILCFIWDTTERRVLEIEKKISQERFRTLVELAPDGIATFNISGHVTFLNQAFCDLTGFTNEELLGKHITNLKTLRKRDLLKYIISFTKVLQGKTPQPMEFIYNKNNGTTGVGKAHIALVEVDGKKEMLLMASDITTRKKQETQFNQLLENTLDGIIEIDKDGVIKRINNSAISILEARKNQIIGNNILNVSFLDNKIKNDIRTIISKGTNHKKSKFIKCKLIRSDNKDIWGEICIHPITIDKERFGIQLFIRDSSRRKEVGLSETNFNTVAIETRYEDNPVTHNSHLFENNIIEQLHLAQNSINNIKINKSYNENLVNQLDDIFTQIINKLDKNTNHIETLLVEEVYSQLSDISNTQ